MSILLPKLENLYDPRSWVKYSGVEETVANNTAVLNQILTNASDPRFREIRQNKYLVSLHATEQIPFLRNPSDMAMVHDRLLFEHYKQFLEWWRKFAFTNPDITDLTFREFFEGIVLPRSWSTSSDTTWQIERYEEVKWLMSLVQINDLETFLGTKISDFLMASKLE